MGQCLQAINYLGAKAAVATTGIGVDDHAATNCNAGRGLPEDISVSFDQGDRLLQAKLHPPFLARFQYPLAQQPHARDRLSSAAEKRHGGVVAQRRRCVGQVTQLSVHQRGRFQPARCGHDLAARYLVDAHPG